MPIRTPAPLKKKAGVTVDQGEFLAWIGQCITIWSSVEERLFNIFWRCLGSTEEHAAIIYYRMPALDARLSMVDEIVKSVLPKRANKNGGHDPPELKHWSGMVQDIRDHLATRRRIAHHPLNIKVRLRDGAGPGLPALEDIIEAWWEVNASTQEQLRKRSNDLRPLKIEDLQAHFVDLSGLRVGLGEFLPRKLLPLLQERVLPALPQLKVQAPENTVPG